MALKVLYTIPSPTTLMTLYPFYTNNISLIQNFLLHELLAFTRYFQLYSQNIYLLNFTYYYYYKFFLQNGPRVFYLYVSPIFFCTLNSSPSMFNTWRFSTIFRGRCLSNVGLVFGFSTSNNPSPQSEELHQQ